MKMTIKILSMTFGVMVASPGFAGCPSSLDADQLVECITIEGSGSNYQYWQKNHAKLAGDSSDTTTKMQKVADVATIKNSQVN